MEEQQVHSYLIDTIETVEEARSTEFTLTTQLMIQRLSQSLSAPSNEEADERIGEFNNRLNDIRAEFNESFDGVVASEEFLQLFEEFVLTFVTPADWRVTWAGIEG